MIITSPVTKAKPEDREEVLKICIEDHAENGQFSLSKPKLEQMVSGILENNKGVIGLIRRADAIEAIMMMHISQFWYTEEWCLEELLNFVRPQFRRSTNAKDMISYAKRCANQLEIPLIVGVVSNERTKPKMELYRRQLGDPVGGYFYYPPKLASQAVTV